jgi:Fe-S cluster biogenesis protein NfuA
LRQRSEVEVVGLVTTLNEAFSQVAMHGGRAELVQAQAGA